MAGKGLPPLVVGKNAADENVAVVISARHRPRGVVIVGQPGTGKSAVTNALALQDIESGAAVFYMEPHEATVGLLHQIPEHRKQDVVLLTFRTEESPLWPVLDVSRTEDERPLMAGLLVDSWRAQYGYESVGPRAASLLRHALLTLPPQIGASPLELMAVLTSQDYRDALLSHIDVMGSNYALFLAWNQSAARLGEPRIQDWVQAVTNKLDPMLDNTWLRLATCGVPPIRLNYNDALNPFRDIPLLDVATLWDDPVGHGIESVTWLRDQYLSVRFKGREVSQICYFDQELDGFLVSQRRGDIVFSEHFPDGCKVASSDYVIDLEDPFIAMPNADEIAQYGKNVLRDVERRRRRRAWTRLAEMVLKPAGVHVREVLDIGDLLDDGKIVLVEVPEVYGKEVTTLTATFAFLSAVLRGHRQLSLPPNRRVPCAIYIDEAALFLSQGIEQVLAELRKAEVGLTIVLQRLGQLGAIDSQFRRGVIDTIGTVVSLPVGIQEVRDVAKMFDVPATDLIPLGVGQGVLMGLTDKGALQEKPTEFRFERPPDTFTAAQKRMAIDIRESSTSRYYQSRSDAEMVFKQRVINIDSYRNRMAGRSEKGTKGRGRSNAKDSEGGGGEPTMGSTKTPNAGSMKPPMDNSEIRFQVSEDGREILIEEDVDEPKFS